MMRPFVHIGKFAWRCGCIACHCLNLALLFLALTQATFFSLNLLQREVPFPDKLATWVLNELGPEQYTATWSKVVFDLRAGLLLSDFALRDTASDQIVITAGQTRLDWSPLHLLFKGIAPFSEIDARDVRLYIPASISPSGLNEPVLFIKDASLSESEGQVLVHSMSIQYGEIHLFLSGSGPLHLLTGRSSTVQDPHIMRLLERLSRLPRDISADARIHWQLLPSNAHILSIEGILPQFAVSNSRFSKLIGTARIRLKNGQAALLNLDLSGSVENLHLPDSLPLPSEWIDPPPFPFHLTADGPLRNVRDVAVPTSIQLSLHPYHPSGLLDHLLLTTAHWDRSSPVHWIASSKRFFASGMAHPQPAGPAPSPPALSFRAYLPSPALVDFVPGPPPARQLENLNARFIRLNAYLDPSSSTLTGSLTCDGLFIANTFFANLHAVDVSLQPESLRFPLIYAQKAADESASGAYFHHLPSSRFSLIAAGNIFPSSLDFLLGPWWVDVFTHIHASQPLAGDVTVWGLWSERESLQSMTHAVGGGASYRGVAVPDLDIRVRSNADWALIEQLRGTFPGGEIRGTVALESGLEEWERLRAIKVELQSDAPWEAVLAASGVEELKLLGFSANPHVEARGWIWRDSGKGHEAAPVADLEVSLVQHEGTCRIEGLELEGLVVQGRADNQGLEFENLTGRFAEGIFTGSMRVDNWQDERQRRLTCDLQLFDAEFAGAVGQLTSLMENPEPVRVALAKEATGGRLDTLVQLKTGPGTAKGTGSVRLRNARVGQIHLFGGLSRFLSGMGIGFSSLELTTASMEWDLDDRLLGIRDGLVTGPALTLDLAGEVDLESKRLSMQAEVTFFEGLLSKILSPVSETLQFDLSGALETPDWQVRISPLRWFQRRMGGDDGADGL